MIKQVIKNLLFPKFDISSYHNYLKRRASGLENHILIACLPKSGSTFIANSLVNITNFEFIQFQSRRATNDHNIDPNILYFNLNKSTITQLHLKPNLLNKELLLESNIKVVFLYRGVLDSLRSLNNHILNENDQWFMFTASEDYKYWSTQKQFDFLIDMVLPWYINFLSSWKIELELQDVKILEIDYDDFKVNNLNTIKKILQFYNLNYSDEKIEKGIGMSYENKSKLRFNEKSITEKYEFTENQKIEVKRKINYYSKLSLKL